MRPLTPRRHAWLGALLLAATATAVTGSRCTLDAYPCSRDSNCVSGGVKGRCLAVGAARYCAFADTTCKPSRMRWDQSADGTVAGQCVDLPDLGAVTTLDMEPPPPEVDMTSTVGPCEPDDPACEHAEVTAPFPLQKDPMPNPAETDSGLDRNGEGDLAIGKAATGAFSLWIASANDAGQRGTVSRFDTRTLREVARYLTVTCSSLKTGSTLGCDGQNGCCSADDVNRYRARRSGQPEPGHQAVKLMQNYPSQTAVDFNGDAFVENYAPGGQGSLTKISGWPATCADRNHNGRIDTSSDTNGDGVIIVDCNGDNQPDDLAGVQKTPCSNNLKQEFYGLDDECVLWTTNVDDNLTQPRALALAPGGSGVGGADPWVAGGQAGHVFHIDSATGVTKEDTTVPADCRPWGATVDGQGVLWLAPYVQGSLCYADTHTPATTGRARQPIWGMVVASGITPDRDQNLWMGAYGMPDALRYTPVRDKGGAALGNGRWVKVTRAGSNAGAQTSGRGIAADSRSPTSYFVWLGEQLGYTIRIPASSIDKMAPGNVDTSIDGSAFPAYKAQGSPVGVVVDGDQNVWTVSQSQVTVTRAKVDANGTATPPVINGQPMGNNVCPAGDVCSLKNMQSYTDTDSDATGFALRNFARGRGTYTWTMSGCRDGNGVPRSTAWYRVDWNANVPSGAAISVRARSGPTATPDGSWGSRTTATLTSPLDLRSLLFPNDNSDEYLQIEFTFTPTGGGLSPTLHSFSVAYRCP